MADPFAAIFMACGLIMVVGLLGFAWMSEKPLRRTQA